MKMGQTLSILYSSVSCIISVRSAAPNKWNLDFLTYATSKP